MFLSLDVSNQFFDGARSDTKNHPSSRIWHIRRGWQDDQGEIEDVVSLGIGRLRSTVCVLITLIRDAFIFKIQS